MQRSSPAPLPTSTHTHNSSLVRQTKTLLKGISGELVYARRKQSDHGHEVGPPSRWCCCSTRSNSMQRDAAGDRKGRRCWKQKGGLLFSTVTRLAGLFLFLCSHGDYATRRCAASSSPSSRFSLISASVRTKRVHSSALGTQICWRGIQGGY